MAVKRSKSGARLLAVFEVVAREQPVGVSELARLTGENKSTAQRMLMTLADAGWIRSVSDKSAQWEPTSRIHSIAMLGNSGSDLRQQAREQLQVLRDKSGETAALTVLEANNFVVVDVEESQETLRMAPRIGQIVPGPLSASALVVLPFLSAAKQASLIGYAPDAQLQAEFEAVVKNGYAMQESEQHGGAVNIAAPIFRADKTPLAAIVLSAPKLRITDANRAAMIRMVVECANTLSMESV